MSDRRRISKREYEGRQSEDALEISSVSSPTPMRPPTILSKSSLPDRERGYFQTDGDSSGPSESTSHHLETKPAAKLRDYKDSGGALDSPIHGSATPAHLSQDTPVITSQVYLASKSNVTHSASEGSLPLRSTAQSLSATSLSNQTVRLIDEALNWCADSGAVETLTDQCDYFVVGVIGPQGSGKSTVLSWLNGTLNDSSAERHNVFKVQSKANIELCTHQTIGAEFFVTADRMLLVDSQPILSMSILNQLVSQERHIPQEYGTGENCIEIQSLQLASFMLSVCHVVLVVSDWFVDVDLVRFLKRAEMLKPPTPVSTNDVLSDDHFEHYPHIAFVINRASSEDFTATSYRTMQATLSHAMEGSKLRYRGSLDMPSLAVHSGLNKKVISDDVNIILLPEINPVHSNASRNSSNKSLDYQGHPPFHAVAHAFAKQMLAVPCSPLTHGLLTERNWVHYSAKMWDAIKKSNLFAEYCRLLP